MSGVHTRDHRAACPALICQSLPVSLIPIRCLVWRPPRAHHCRTCGECLPCVWCVGVCVLVCGECLPLTCGECLPLRQTHKHIYDDTKCHHISNKMRGGVCVVVCTCGDDRMLQVGQPLPYGFSDMAVGVSHSLPHVTDVLSYWIQACRCAPPPYSVCLCCPSSAHHAAPRSCRSCAHATSGSAAARATTASTCTASGSAGWRHRHAPPWCPPAPR